LQEGASTAHSVRVLDPDPSAPCKPSADTPFFCDVTNHTAANHVDSGECERWKIVPAVTDVLRPQAAHMSWDLAVRHTRSPPQAGQTNPPGQRSRSK
jgi:hypothetical protein